MHGGKNLEMESLMGKIGGMTIGQTVLVALAFSVGYYYFFFNDGYELEGRLAQLKSEVTAQETVAGEVRKSLAEGKRFKEELESMSEKFEQAIKFLPSEINMTEVLRKVTQQVRAAGASSIRLQPQGQTVKKELYEEFYIDIELRGDYSQLTMVLANLSKLQRIINIRNFEMVVKDDKAEVPELSFLGRLVGYRYTGEK